MSCRGEASPIPMFAPTSTCLIRQDITVVLPVNQAAWTAARATASKFNHSSLCLARYQGLIVEILSLKRGLNVADNTGEAIDKIIEET